MVFIRDLSLFENYLPW